VNAGQFAAFQERIRLGSKAVVVPPEPAAPPGPSPIELLRQRAAEDDVDALLQLAQALQTGDGVDPDPDGALALLERADSLGSSEGTLAYSMALMKPTRTQDQKNSGFLRLIALASGDSAIGMEAAYQLGVVHRHGCDVVVRTPSTALAYFKQAATGGHPEAEQYYAMYLDQGLGCPADHALACQFYERSSNHASPRGMFRYARMLLLGDGVPPNIPEGVRLFEYSAQHGCNEANFYLWGIFNAGFKEVIPRDPVRAERHARIGAEREIVGCELEYADLLGATAEAGRLRAHALAPGRADVQIEAGRLYEEGIVVPANYDRARALYEAAVANGGKEGLFELGRLVLEQFKDPDESARILRIGAEKWCVQCRLFLAEKIQDTTFAAASESEIKDLIVKARGQKSLKAMVMLGRLYLQEESYPKARKEFESARNGGSADGSEWLAECYAKGWGISRNVEKAAELRAEAQERRERDMARLRGDASPGLAKSGVAAPPE
jgi:TPR repeat protein